MTENFQPSEDIFDDVEGHAVKSGRIVTPETDDVEGHRVFAADTDDDDDVEGHGVRVRF